MSNLYNISQDEFEHIEAYLNNQLDNDDLRVFKNRLNEDISFKNKVDDVKTVLLGIETQALKEQLEEFHSGFTEETNAQTLKSTPKIRRLNWRKVAIAASLILAAGSFWLVNDDPNEKLYTKYFTPDPGLPTNMSSDTNFEFYDAMVNYKQGNYKTAISKWEFLQKTKPNNDTLDYFIGVAHLANKNEKEAINFLEIATKNSDFPLINDAYYYLGLAYLKEGNINMAKKNLKNSDTSKQLLSELSD